jgi:hypothetical protein
MNYWRVILGLNWNNRFWLCSWEQSGCAMAKHSHLVSAPTKFGVEIGFRLVGIGGRVDVVSTASTRLVGSDVFFDV